MDEYNWEEVSRSIDVTSNETFHRQIWGKVYRHNPRTIVYWRNYGRELKNGKGLNMHDRLSEMISSTQKDLEKQLIKGLFDASE